MEALSRAALEFARARHEGQRRDADDQPFVLHPQEVARLLDEAGYPDHVVASGALHDVLEDTDAEREELERRFGPEVARLVESLTDDPSIEDEQERRAALRRQVADADEEAAAVFAADKISKARELRFKAERGDLTAEDRAKVEHYDRSLEMLEERLPGHALVEQLRRELEPLRDLAAHGYWRGATLPTRGGQSRPGPVSRSRAAARPPGGPALRPPSA